MAHVSLLRPNLLLGRTAIVTGGGTGIGRAITRELLSLGCRVVIASRNLDTLKQTAAELGADAAIGVDVKSALSVVECNIRDEDAVERLIGSALDTFGNLDYLVNNGGGQFPAAAKEISRNGWNAVVETNLLGTFTCCREAFTQHFEANPRTGGAIVNITCDHFG